MLTSIRKPLISGFIVLALGAQILQNLGVGYIGARAGTGGPLAVAAGGIDRLRQGIETFAFYTSTNTYWRMFSPVHRSDWWWVVIATDAQGGERELSAPEVRASAPSSLLVDFREAKLLLNMWTRAPMQAAYLDHRCAEEARAGRRAASIRLELHWRGISTPEEAAAGRPKGAVVGVQQMATRTCR